MEGTKRAERCFQVEGYYPFENAIYVHGAPRRCPQPKVVEIMTPPGYGGSIISTDN